MNYYIRLIIELLHNELEYKPIQYKTIFFFSILYCHVFQMAKLSPQCRDIFILWKDTCFAKKKNVLIFFLINDKHMHTYYNSYDKFFRGWYTIINLRTLLLNLRLIIHFSSSYGVVLNLFQFSNSICRRQLVLHKRTVSQIYFSR